MGLVGFSFKARMDSSLALCHSTTGSDPKHWGEEGLIFFLRFGATLYPLLGERPELI